MGMFDEVICEAPLPVEVPDTARPFQTKDFECILQTLKITADGRLKRGTYEWRDDPDSPLGAFIHQTGWETVTDYHGRFNFYTSHDDEWFEFEAKFTDGKLVDIREAKP